MTLPTFDELPDSPTPEHLSGGPTMEDRIATPDPEPASAKPNAPAGAGAQYIPVPVPVIPPQPNPQESDAAFFRNLAMYEAEKERRAMEAQAAEAWRRAQTPPPLPDDPDELLTDGKKFRDALAQRDQFYMNAIQMNVQPLLEQMGAMNQELAEARVLRADIAMRDARAELHRRGQQEDMAVWQQVEGLLRNDPQNYWKLRTNPEAMFTAYNVVAQNMRPTNGGPATPQMRAPNAPTAGYGGAPSGGGRNAPAIKDDTLLRVEQQLGVKLSDKDVREYQRRLAASGRR